MPSAAKVAAKFAGMQMEAMSNLRPSETGIPGAIIWVSAGEVGGTDLQHGPRIKVMLGRRVTAEALASAVTVTLRDPPQVLGDLPAKVEQQVLEFCQLNRKVLLRYWAGKLSTLQALGQIKRVG